nr:UvrD-helicase domain-containing protein [Treponema sp.]
MSKNDPTVSQQKAIGIDINAVVSAGAGSGKTSVLSQRFVHLVLDKKYKVDEILTLTFTKKATVEMYGRIYQKLKEKSPESVSDFYKANIKNLDSYCTNIARQGCHFYGISPDFTEDEDALHEKIESLALPFILQHRDNQAIKALVQTKNFSDIARELFVDPILQQSTIAEPIDFDKCNENQRQEIIKGWDKEYKKTLGLLNSINGELNDFEGNRNSAFIKKLTEAMNQDWPEISDLTEQKIEDSDCQQEIQFLKALINVTSLSLRTPNGCDEIKRIIKDLRESLLILTSLVQYVSGYDIIKTITPLLKEFQDKVLHIKRSLGILSFNDVSSLAKCILRDYPEIRQLEKQKYKAIMIDEFQDNNMLQRDILFMIAEKLERTDKGIPSVSDLCPGKLFFVGDEKQSIYRFRGADVTVFRGLSKDFEKGNLELKENFRSEKNLVCAFNTIFGGFSYPDNKEQNQPSVFFKQDNGEAGEETPEYEAVYHKVNYPEAKPQESCSKELIHVALYDKNQEADEGMLIEEEAEALWVAKKIKELITPASKSTPAKYKPGDIAILFRNYSLQPLYERMLLQEGIPYNCEVVTGFFNDGPVNDIFAMLRLCAYKTDTLSYAAVLRSPFANLSIEETNAILAQSSLSQSEGPFAADSAKILNPQSEAKYRHAKEVYEELCERSKTESLTSLISFLWYNAGYRLETLWNTSVSMYASLYDRMFELARKAEEQTMSLASFVDSMRTYQDEAQKLSNMDIPLEHEDSIHILTIHKSKGLEFPAVFVCGTHKGSKKETNSTPVYCSRKFGVSINTPPLKEISDSKENYFYARVKKINSAMESAELK